MMEIQYTCEEGEKKTEGILLLDISEEEWKDIWEEFNENKAAGWHKILMSYEYRFIPIKEI